MTGAPNGCREEAATPSRDADNRREKAAARGARPKPLERPDRPRKARAAAQLRAPGPDAPGRP
eukprot:2795014-Lingulodinium_polyedra.AAC.1